jgi:hypothetical protein
MTSTNKIQTNLKSFFKELKGCIKLKEESYFDDLFYKQEKIKSYVQSIKVGDIILFGNRFFFREICYFVAKVEKIEEQIIYTTKYNHYNIQEDLTMGAKFNLNGFIDYKQPENERVRIIPIDNYTVASKILLRFVASEYGELLHFSSYLTNEELQTIIDIQQKVEGRKKIQEESEKSFISLAKNIKY